MPRPAAARRSRLGLALTALLAVLVAVLVAAAPGSAAAATARTTNTNATAKTNTKTKTKTVRYHGLALTVPSSWPVFRLAWDPATCVRFNRHAVYLGVPGRAQACPPPELGRTEAILVAPARAGGRDALDAGAAARVLDRAHGLVVTATWDHRPGVIRRALHVASLAPYERAARAEPAPAPASRRRSPIRERTAIVSPPATPGEVFSGLGFDACTTPSPAAMAAWATASPYGAIGVYIGGANLACSQPNLGSTWVSGESAAGWHLIPIYVGLQAPGNSCGCAAISAASAASQGAAAAADAVAHAAALGIGAGNPILYDMEGYTAGGTVSSTVLAFLGAWTATLHVDGYRSGVYSSENSGIADLVSEVGTGYLEPDELWIANWNNSPITTDPSVPAADWVGQRLHQYHGAVEQTYGGVRIDVDQDAVDASTAAAGAGGGLGPAPVVEPVPAATDPPTIAGAPILGQTLTESHAAWSGSPTGFAYQWEDCTPGAVGCTPILGATGPAYTLTAGDVGHTVVVEETASNAGGAGTPVISTATASVQRVPTAGYWLMTAFGNVAASPGATWFGSALGARVASITGMALTPRRLGYWLVDAAGRVFSYGNARAVSTGRYGHAIRGVVAASGGGVWLYTAQGNVFAEADAPWYGSLKHVRHAAIVAMVATADRKGYWLADATGRIFAFGDAAKLGSVAPPGGIRGMIAAPTGGLWMFTGAGGVISLAGAPNYGSLVVPADPSIVGMAATRDGRGYWFVNAAGLVIPFGDAARWRLYQPSHPVIGVVS